MITLADRSVIPLSFKEAEAIADIEAHQNYHNYFIGKNRTEEQLKEHIYKGKLAECIVALKFRSIGYKILRGVRILQATPDDGTDLIVETDTGLVMKIQVKLSNGKFYNIYSEQRLQALIDYKGYTLVCDITNQNIYKLLKRSLKSFRDDLQNLRSDHQMPSSGSRAYHMLLSQLEYSKKLNCFTV